MDRVDAEELIGALTSLSLAAEAVLNLVEHDYINYGSWDGPNTKVEHRPTKREPGIPCRRCALEAATEQAARALSGAQVTSPAGG